MSFQRRSQIRTYPPSVAGALARRLLVHTYLAQLERHWERNSRMKSLRLEEHRKGKSFLRPYCLAMYIYLVGSVVTRIRSSHSFRRAVASDVEAQQRLC